MNKPSKPTPMSEGQGSELFIATLRSMNPGHDLLRSIDLVELRGGKFVKVEKTGPIGSEVIRNKPTK